MLIYAGTMGMGEEMATHMPTVTREITQLKLPKQQPGRVYVQTGFTDEPWPSLVDMCVGVCFGSGAMRPASWQVY